MERHRSFAYSKRSPRIAAVCARILFAAVLTSLIPACTPKTATTEGKADGPAIPVTVATAKTAPLRRTVPVVGTLNGYEDMLVSPKVDGRVARVLKDVGDAVAPGEVLFEIDPTDYLLAVAQARPAFQAELKKLQLDALPTLDEDLEAVIDRVPAVAQAQANLELAEKELSRTETENAKGVGAAQSLDAARTKLKVAKTAVQLAQTDARVTLAQARKLKAALDDAEERLRETEVRAPMPHNWSAWSAIVTPAANPLVYSVAGRMISKGEMIRQMPVTNVFRLVIEYALKLRVAAPEKYRPEVHRGQPVEIRVEAYPGVVFPGVVSRVNPTVDVQNRTFMVEILATNCSRRLSVGGFAKAEILTQLDNAVLTVPPEAVKTFAGVSKVFVLEGNTARAIEVEPGARDKEWVEVRGPLAPGQRVITSGLAQLVDGTTVRVR
jgi:multidrug efflux pump subunit AcrA (membrane-fusion protein)